MAQDMGERCFILALAIKLKFLVPAGGGGVLLPLGTLTSLQLAAAICNTTSSSSSSGVDELDSSAQFLALLDRHQAKACLTFSSNPIGDVGALRDRLRRAWTAEPTVMVSEVNALMSGGSPSISVTTHDELSWHLHAGEEGLPLAEQIGLLAALALVDVLRAGLNDRLRVCQARDCSGLLLDCSRNSSKRFCSVRCGNRVNMVAFRTRSNGAVESEPARSLTGYR